MCDMANSVQRLAKEKSGMGKRLTVIGASTGAIQALQIGVSYADMAQNFVAITPLGRTAPRTTNVLARQTVMTDPAWNGGDPPPSAPPEKACGHGS